MHDPLVVAFEIRRPWPQRGHPASPRAKRWRIGWASSWMVAGHPLWFPPLITVWHREPGGHDAFTICRTHITRGNGTTKVTNAWRWHLQHWRLQVPPLQQLRRRLLTRCTWCGGRSVKGDAVNVSNQWDGPRGRWWQGEPGLYHGGCSGIASAHRTCVCEYPVLEHEGYGHCARCTRFRPFGMTDEALARARELSAIPAGSRRGDA